VIGPPRVKPIDGVSVSRNAGLSSRRVRVARDADHVAELTTDSCAQPGRALDLLAENALSEVRTASASTETERALYEVFEEHFGVVPHIDDDFFSPGLDRIPATSMVSKARRRGLALSPRTMMTDSTIRALAAIDASAGPDTDVESADYGEVKPFPMVSWLCERGNYRRFTHNVLLRPPSDVDRASIATMCSYSSMGTTLCRRP
jgi:mycobactin peptide synthetase MbtF